MHSHRPLPPELDPAAPDPTLEPPHESGDTPGRHGGGEQHDPDLEPGPAPG
jgi:hypothetical protein